MWGGLKYPDVFSKIGAISPSFWFDDPQIYEFAYNFTETQYELETYFYLGGQDVPVDGVATMYAIMA